MNKVQLAGRNPEAVSSSDNGAEALLLAVREGSGKMAVCLGAKPGPVELRRNIVILITDYNSLLFMEHILGAVLCDFICDIT